MAQISVAELVELLSRRRSQPGESPPTELIQIVDFGRPQAEEEALHPALAGKTLSYEGRTRTVVLDFDEKGFVTGIQLV